MAKKQKHILVADDDPIYREVATEALEKAGHKITQAVDGGHAIALLDTGEFDLAIVDLTMPVADGIAVIERLRAGKQNPALPVIVITGHDDASAVERAYEVGATSFLTKPLNWVLFTPHVEFVLRSGQTETELREANAASAFMSELKSQMMSSLAQEFQTPIKTIFGFSELIHKEVYGPLSPPVYREMISDISKSAHNINAALLKLMNFGHTLTEQLEIKVEAVKPLNAVVDAVDALNAVAERRGITIKTTIAIPADAMILADKALLNQALRSMLDNAIRLSPRDAEVLLTANLGKDGNLCVSVSDRGPPVPEELLNDVNGTPVAKRTFARHQEARDVSIKIAKVLAEAHKGTISITTDRTGGNCVRLDMPKDGRKSNIVLPSASKDPSALDRLAAIGAEIADDLKLNRRTLGVASAAVSRSGGQS